MIAVNQLPQAETRYLEQVVARLQQNLLQDLMGVYLFGSAATGAYEPGISDLDVQAVVAVSLERQHCEQIAASLRHDQLPCPARRLEFVVYRQAAVSPATRHPRFELNFNTGAGEPDHLTLDPSQEASHWFLLDIAMGREVGQRLYGSQLTEVFAPVPRLWCLEAIADSLAWHREHEVTSANNVLNACRGWRYAATGSWGSKLAGAEWARQHAEYSVVVEHALQRRHGGAPLDPGAVTALVNVVTEAVRDAIRRERKRT